MSHAGEPQCRCVQQHTTWTHRAAGQSLIASMQTPCCLRQAGFSMLLRSVGSRWVINLVEKHDVPAALVVVVVVVGPVVEREAAAPPGVAELLGVVQHHAIGSEQNTAPLPCFVQCSCPANCTPGARHGRQAITSRGSLRKASVHAARTLMLRQMRPDIQSLPQCLPMA